MGGPVPTPTPAAGNTWGREGGWREGRERARSTRTSLLRVAGGGAGRRGGPCVMNLISAHTLSSGGGFSSPDFCLLVPLPVCVATTNGAGRGAQEAPPALPGAAVPLGRWRLFLGTPAPRAPPAPHPGLTRQQTHRPSGLTSGRGARRPCPHRQLCSQFLLSPSLRPEDHCSLSCSVTSQWGTPNLCWLLPASFEMTDRPSSLPSPPQALLPTGACPQKERSHSARRAPGLAPEPSTSWACPSQPCSTRPQLTETSS